MSERVAHSVLMHSRIVDIVRVRPRGEWRVRALALAVAALVAACSGATVAPPDGASPDQVPVTATPVDEVPVDLPGDGTVDGSSTTASTDTVSDDEPDGQAGELVDGADHDLGTAPACVEPDPGATEPLRITVWHGLNGEQALTALDELIDDFVDDNPGIEVEIVPTQGYVDALDKLRRSTVDELPDLFMGAVDDVGRLAEAELFVTPERCWGSEPEVLADLLPVVRATLSVDGELQAYPFNISSPVAIYDRTLFAQYGLDPDRPPTTPAELRQMLEVLVSGGGAPAGLVLYDRSASWFVEQWAVADGRVLVEPDNGRGGHPIDGFRFVTDEAVEALGWLRALADDDLVTWVGTNESGLDDLLRLVDLSDRAAMTFHTSAVLGELALLLYEPGVPELEDAELGVGPLPTPSGEASTLVGGGSLWLVDRGDAVRLGAAASLAEHLLAPEAQARFTAATGYVPVTRSAAASPVTQARWAELPQFAVSYEQVAGLEGTPAQTGMQIGPRVAVQRVIEEIAAEVIVLGRAPAEALAEGEARATEIVRRYEYDLDRAPEPSPEP